MKTLLLADDSVTIQRVIELTFAQEDVRVVSVGDGRRAVQWMDSGSPDIVLVDVAAPEVNGYALAAHVRQSARLRHVPVLLLAGAFDPVDEDRARAAGCDAILVKPFEPQHLVNQVSTLLQQAATARVGPVAVEEPRGRRVPESDGPAVVTPFPAIGRAAAQVTDPAPAHAPVMDQSGRAARDDRRASEPALPSRVSLANAFAALLAAEHSSQTPPQPVVPPALPDAVVEEAVRRALVRMTDDLVRRIVVETAERLIREEIEKIKTHSE
jgi:CheY-like chemotaxis protein